MKIFDNMFNAIRAVDSAIGQNKGVHVVDSTYAFSYYEDLEQKIEYFAQGKKGEVLVKIEYKNENGDYCWMNEKQTEEFLTVLD